MKSTSWNPIHYPLYSIDYCLSCENLIFVQNVYLKLHQSRRDSSSSLDSLLMPRSQSWDESWILGYERFSHSFGINLIWFLCYWGVCGLKAWDQVKRKDKIESLLFFKKKKMSKKMGLVRIGSKKRQGDIKRSKPRCRNSK